MPNNDLISRAAAIDEIEEYIEEYSELEPETGYHNLKWCAMEEAKDVLLMLPAVDAVQVVHGRWEEKMEHAGYACCSVCHDCYVEKELIFNMKWAWCPQCGARMDGGETDG